MVDIPCSLILTAKNIHCSREVNDHVLSCFPWEAVLHFINGSTGCLCNWSKSIRGGHGPEQKGNGSSVFQPYVRGGSFNFQLPMGVGHPVL